MTTPRPYTAPRFRRQALGSVVAEVRCCKGVQGAGPAHLLSVSGFRAAPPADPPPPTPTQGFGRRIPGALVEESRWEGDTTSSQSHEPTAYLCLWPERLRCRTCGGIAGAWCANRSKWPSATAEAAYSQVLRTGLVAAARLLLHLGPAHLE